MTLMSEGKAILFGGIKDAEFQPIRNCWLLDIAKVIKGEFTKPSSLWEHCEQHEGYLRALSMPGSLREAPELKVMDNISSAGARGFIRMGHSAVVEPVSKRLWILGGVVDGRITDEMLSMSFNSGASLKLLAMESALRHFRLGHPFLEATELPRHLKMEFENRYVHCSCMKLPR